ncbi:hypothetical protein FQR65_LT14519 [Abscondita terminalis]|nr:hypothetical protein FQR65_LT14519 [Abscondita terminalis]
MFERRLLETSQSLLQTIDLSPMKRNRAGLIFRWIGCVLVIVHAFLIVYESVSNWEGVKTIEYVGEYAVSHYQSVCKLLMAIVHRDKLDRLFLKMQRFQKLESLDSSLGAELGATFKKWSIALKLYVGNGGLCTIMIILRPLLMNVGDLPVPLYTFNYEIKSPFYEFFYCLEGIQYVYMGILELALDMLFFSFIVYVYYELKIVTNHFERFTIGDETTKRFGEIIDHHNFTLSCVSDLNSIYPILFLNQLLSNMFMMCMSMLVLISGAEITVGLLASHGFFLVSVFIQLFCYCLAGAKITEQSSKVSVAIFQAPWWMDAPMHLKRNVINVIQKAQKNVTISAGESDWSKLSSKLKLKKKKLNSRTARSRFCRRGAFVKFRTLYELYVEDVNVGKLHDGCLHGLGNLLYCAILCKLLDDFFDELVLLEDLNLQENALESVTKRQLINAAVSVGETQRCCGWRTTTSPRGKPPRAHFRRTELRRKRIGNRETETLGLIRYRHHQLHRHQPPGPQYESNRIEYINEDCFKDLVHLNELHLRKNNIMRIYPNGSSGLGALNLEDNIISTSDLLRWTCEPRASQRQKQQDHQSTHRHLQRLAKTNRPSH